MRYVDYDNMRREYILEGGKVIVKSTQDVEPLLERNKRLRDTENVTGKVGEWKHYASVPMVIVEELMKKGINMFSNDKDQLKAAQKEIETNYPYLKTTNLKGW